MGGGAINKCSEVFNCPDYEYTTRHFNETKRFSCNTPDANEAAILSKALVLFLDSRNLICIARIDEQDATVEYFFSLFLRSSRAVCF